MQKRRRRRPPPIVFARIVRSMNDIYNFAADIFHTKKLYSRLSSSEVQLYTEIGRFAPLSLPLGDLRATYEDDLWKLHSRLPISVNWSFFARCYGWGATSDYRFKIGDFAPTGAGWPKISGRRGRPHQPFFFSENYAKCSFVWYKNMDWFFFRSVTIHAVDAFLNWYRRKPLPESRFPWPPSWKIAMTR